MSKKKIYLSEAQVNDVIGQDGYLDNSDTTNNITDTNHETMVDKPEMPQETPIDKQILGATNNNLHNAKREKNDEFYTKNADIERELQHYLPYLKGKRVVCPCDTENSEFVKYFMANGERIGILTLGYSHLSSGVDFRNVDYSNYDVVITNPPFSLFREFIATMEANHMDYLVIGSKNAITYKEIFPLLQHNKMWLGVNNVTTFTKPDGSEQKFGNIGWFTNIPHNKRNAFIPLTKKYVPELYPKYDNYNAIDISKVADIPADYDGYMGVPISFLDKYNPEQFEIIKFRKGDDGRDLCVNGKCPYFRIIIKKRQ